MINPWRCKHTFRLRNFSSIVRVFFENVTFVFKVWCHYVKSHVRFIFIPYLTETRKPHFEAIDRIFEAVMATKRAEVAGSAQVMKCQPWKVYNSNYSRYKSILE